MKCEELNKDPEAQVFDRLWLVDLLKFGLLLLRTVWFWFRVGVLC